MLSNYFAEIWSEADGKEKRLDDKHWNILRTNLKTLTISINLSDELLGKLHDAGCVTDIQRAQILLEWLNEANRNKKLLEIMSYKSIATFHKFLNCLATIHQQYDVESLLTNSGRK